jgi:hypothetical protein
MAVMIGARILVLLLAIVATVLTLAFAHGAILAIFVCGAITLGFVLPLFYGLSGNGPRGP